jgi:predicted ATPase
LSKPRIKNIWIKNFKSLKNVEIELRDFNLLVGPNGSGKTNIIEVFKLIKRIHFQFQVNPFIEWWGYQNVVWMGEEELPITIGYEFEIAGYAARYEVCITGRAGKFEVLKEIIDVLGVVTIDRVGNTIRIQHNPDLVDAFFEDIKDARIIGEVPERRGLIDKTYEAVLQDSFIFTGWSARYHKNWAILTLHIPQMEGEPLKVISPVVKTFSDAREREVAMPLVGLVIGERFLEPKILLRQLDFKTIKTPKPVKKDTVLAEDGSNLSNVFHTIYMEKDVPSRIKSVINAVFGENKEIMIKPALTDDGRVYIRVYEGDHILYPPMVADGFWKLLSILLAIETKPALLIIDELENSLHPKALEYVVTELKNSGCTVIAATHSPAVVDMVNPEDLLLVGKNSDGETEVRRIKEPEKLRSWMSEYGITLSEGWLYGEL